MIRSDVVTALQHAFWLAVEDILYHHTNPWELDEALTAWGYTMGPCEAQDLRGLEHVLDGARSSPGPVLPRMLAEGRMGKIGGVGFYRYPGGGGAVIDPLIEDLILEEAWFGKITRSDLSDMALVDRMNASLKEPCLELRAKRVTDQTIAQLLVRAVHFPPDQELPF